MTKNTQQLTKSLLFAQALIAANGNATEAARRTFRLGSKGGKNVQRTAESMGSEYLRKPEVQKHLTELLDAGAMNRNWLMLQLKELCEQRADQHLALKSLMFVTSLLGLLPEEQEAAHGHGDPQRRTVFMLSPPSMPPNGVPPPALEKQWREMGWNPGWKPGIEPQNT
ncbi:hypothetical protein AUJ46_05255 [Candidatus Peregrinibacteria bacterium CG1_02_54_53]|nr:MAG: hypothetical protein AUJ46_05255 [Candidatus Peregrinibacteria bacterium CG1_02_54_53]